MGALLGGALVVWGALRYDFLADDAFITLRYARNWIDGHGLVFNPGERVEGYTSLLWLAVVAGFGRAGADLVAAARGLGLAFSLALVTLTAWIASRLGRVSAAVLLAPLLVAANSSFASWALGGLETSLFAFLALLSLFVAWREEASSASLPWSAACVLLAVTTRPEGILLAVPIAVFKLTRGGRHRSGALHFKRALAFAAPLAAGAGALVLWRLWYYGAPLPNTYYAKMGGGLAQAARGVRYVGDFLLDTGGLLAMPLAAAALARRASRPVAALFGSGALALLAATAVEGGDALPMYRFCVAPLALAAVAIGLGLELVLERLRLAPRAATAWGAALGAVLVGVAWKDPSIWPYAERLRVHKLEVERWSAAGRWLARHAPPRASFAAVPIGAVSYFSGLRAIDMLGLTDVHIGRRKMPAMGHGVAGHEKHDGPYVLSLRPTFLLLGNINVSDRPPQNRISMDDQTREREGDILSPELHQSYTFGSAALDDGRWLGYLVRRDAVLR